MGERTDFSKYLSALVAAHVVFDPGSKIDAISTVRPKVKARRQFRMPRKRLSALYERFEGGDLSIQP